MGWTAMRRPLIGWTAAVCMLTAFALASGSPPTHSAADVIEGSAVILLFIVIAIVSWHGLSEPTRNAIKRLFDD
jgi:hypothetical protein